MQDDITKGDEFPSSPDMISFELLNDDFSGPHILILTNNDRFVEYQLQDMTSFPSCAEEKEKVHTKFHISHVVIFLSWKSLALKSNAIVSGDLVGICCEIYICLCDRDPTIRQVSFFISNIG